MQNKNNDSSNNNNNVPAWKVGGGFGADKKKKE